MGHTRSQAMHHCCEAGGLTGPERIPFRPCRHGFPEQNLRSFSRQNACRVGRGDWRCSQRSLAIHTDRQLVAEVGIRPNDKPFRIDVVWMLMQEVLFDLFADKVDARLAIKSNQRILERSKLIRGSKPQPASFRDRRRDPMALLLKQQAKRGFSNCVAFNRSKNCLMPLECGRTSALSLSRPDTAPAIESVRGRRSFESLFRCAPVALVRHAAR